MALKECADQIGNTLHKGDLLYVDGEGKVLIGEVMKITHGGISSLDGRGTPAELTISIKVTIGGPPGCKFPGVFALRHPTRKEDEDLTLPTPGPKGVIIPS